MVSKFNAGKVVANGNPQDALKPGRVRLFDDYGSAMQYCQPIVHDILDYINKFARVDESLRSMKIEFGKLDSGYAGEYISGEGIIRLDRNFLDGIDLSEKGLPAESSISKEQFLTFLKRTVAEETFHGWQDSIGLFARVKKFCEENDSLKGQEKAKLMLRAGIWEAGAKFFDAMYLYKGDNGETATVTAVISDLTSIFTSIPELDDIRSVNYYIKNGMLHYVSAFLFVKAADGNDTTKQIEADNARTLAIQNMGYILAVLTLATNFDIMKTFDKLSYAPEKIFDDIAKISETEILSLLGNVCTMKEREALYPLRQ
jgi:hypothetical protein